jgi:hypothetical protein
MYWVTDYDFFQKDAFDSTITPKNWFINNYLKSGLDFRKKIASRQTSPGGEQVD